MEHDPVNFPLHYQFNKVTHDVEDVIHDRLVSLKDVEELSVATALLIARPYANAIKYTLRAFHKNGIEDLKKARRELDQIIEILNTE
jgi:hypothetical protein